MPGGSFTVSAVNPDGSLIVTQPIATNSTIVGQPLVSAVLAKDPTVVGAYAFSLNDVACTAAANNYLIIYNPIGNTRSIAPFTSAVSSYVTTGSITGNHSILMQRVTAVSGGTLQPNSAINKAVSTYPNATAQIFTGNATATAGTQFAAFPPAVSAGSGAVVTGLLQGPTNGGPFILAPGEGIAWLMTASATNLNLNLSIFWGEV